MAVTNHRDGGKLYTFSFTDLHVMSNNSSQDAPLAVRPNEEGVKRRQAEFLVLYTLCNLCEEGVASKKELKPKVRSLAKKIAQSEKEPPIYFNTTSGRTIHQDREFNEVLDRCLRRGWIESTIDEKYGVTNKGEERVAELESGNQYRINQDIKNAI